jgi:hypothetical protein
MIPDKLCLLWTSTRDNILRKSNYPCKYRYGLELEIKDKNLHLLLCILLAGDIATNPGPCRTISFSSESHHEPKNRESKGLPATCLVLNARSLKSQHVLDGKKFSHLSRFHELVYSEAADLVWVTETWLTKDVANTEILHDDYAIYRKDREPRTGGAVMVAVKSSSFISSRDVDIETDIEVVVAAIIHGILFSFYGNCRDKIRALVGNNGKTHSMVW